MVEPYSQTRPEIPEPDYDDPKELYAFFGLAMYNAQLIEQGIVNLFVGLQCLGKAASTWGDVNTLYDKADKDTLGRLLHAVRELVPFDSTLDEELRDVLEKRNYLAHLFFVEHAESLLSETGRRKMIDELREIIALFKTVDPQVDKLWVAVWSKYILPDEQIQREFDAVKRSVQGRAFGVPSSSCGLRRGLQQAQKYRTRI